MGDAGLEGYLDNVVVSTTAGATTYDFEAPVAAKEDCKGNSHLDFGFANRGACVSSLQADFSAGK